MSYDATSMRLFVDGTKVATLTGPTTPANSTGDAHIGFEPRESVVSASLLGFISEVRLSTVARYDADFVSPIHLGTDANTAAFWKLDEGSGTTANDASGNANSGTITGAAWMTAPCR
jgi:hypothetical protein